MRRRLLRLAALQIHRAAPERDLLVLIQARIQQGFAGLVRPSHVDLNCAPERPELRQGCHVGIPELDRAQHAERLRRVAAREIEPREIEPRVVAPLGRGLGHLREHLLARGDEGLALALVPVAEIEDARTEIAARLLGAPAYRGQVQAARRRDHDTAVARVAHVQIVVQCLDAEALRRCQDREFRIAALPGNAVAGRAQRGRHDHVADVGIGNADDAAELRHRQLELRALGGFRPHAKRDRHLGRDRAAPEADDPVGALEGDRRAQPRLRDQPHDRSRTDGKLLDQVDRLGAGVAQSREVELRALVEDDPDIRVAPKDGGADRLGPFEDQADAGPARVACGNLGIGALHDGILRRRVSRLGIICLGGLLDVGDGRGRRRSRLFRLILRGLLRRRLRCGRLRCGVRRGSRRCRRLLRRDGGHFRRGSRDGRLFRDLEEVQDDLAVELEVPYLPIALPRQGQHERAGFRAGLRLCELRRQAPSQRTQVDSRIASEADHHRLADFLNPVIDRLPPVEHDAEIVFVLADAHRHGRHGAVGGSRSVGIGRR